MDIPKPKILLNGKDQPQLPSGYGIMVSHLAPLLADHYGPENIIIYAPVYQRDFVGEYKGMKVLPGLSGGFGEDWILEHYQQNECNMLLQMGDAWPLGALPDMAAKNQILWIQWLPWDWLGAPKNVQLRIKPAHKIVTFAKYGEEQARKAGLTNIERTIWLGLDTDLWKPMDMDDPKIVETKAALGYDNDTFNILMVAANQDRKGIREQLEAIRLFREVHPEAKPRLYLHSNRQRERDLRADLDELELLDIEVHPDGYLYHTAQIPEKDMVKVFNSADVVMNCCMEGFGYAMLQAQAVGVNCIFLMDGTGPELVKAGVGVPSVTSVTDARQFCRPLPHPVAICSALEAIWEKQQQAGHSLRSPDAVEFVQKNFSWAKIAEQWIEVIDKVMWERAHFCMDIPPFSEALSEKSRNVLEIK